MKCLWYAALAILLGVSISTSATAQSDWGSPSQIGSYQAILSSYAQQQGGSGSSQLPMQTGPMQTGPNADQPITNWPDTSRK